MKEAKVDRRVRYTAAVLRQSLVGLMKDHHISKISVKMLCEEADINRSTFYAHYATPYDLLRQLEGEVIAEIGSQINRHPVNAKMGNSEEIMAEILEYAARNVDLFRVLLSENGDAGFIRDIMTLAQEQLIQSLKSDRHLDGHTSEYLQCFVITGALKVLQKWIEEGARETPRQMAELTSKLLFQGIASFL